MLINVRLMEQILGGGGAGGCAGRAESDGGEGAKKTRRG